MKQNNKIKTLLKNIFIFTTINCYWYLFKSFLYKPKIMTKEETLYKILENGLSISRFGDGEFRLMTKKGHIGFQSDNEQLSDALIKSFKTNNKKLLICSSDYGEKRPMFNKSGKWLKGFLYKYYKYIRPMFNRDYYYGNAGITRFYDPYFYKYTDFSYLKNTYIPILKSIWNNRDLLIVEGKATKLGIGNDLFENACSLKRIICPSSNAYDKYNEIRDTVIKKYRNGELVLLALGPTASVLSADLCINNNIQCIDIGHIDIVYMWFLNRSRQKQKIKFKHVNEADSESEIHCIFNEKKYLDEIIATIDG